jgi:glycosyltransferase involved in cell wall biosynthesis
MSWPASEKRQQWSDKTRSGVTSGGAPFELSSRDCKLQPREAMRIAYMLTSLGIGGAERQAMGLAERVRASGHAVKVLVLKPPEEEQWPSQVEVVHLNLHKGPLSLVASLARAARVLRQFRPDILHCHNFHGNVFGRMLKPALRNVSVISTIHNVYEGGWPRMTAYKLSDPLSRCTVGVCKAAANRMVEAGAVPQRKCDVIQNGVDPSEFAPDPERRMRTRCQMRAKDEFIWVAAGRVVPAKNYENLMRAFAWVQQAPERGALWIAGEEKGAYAEQMRALAIELGLERSIRWLGLRRDIAALLDAADGVVLASAWEGMPLALAEAMAMEKPVVATDVGGVRELVDDCGTVVPAGNCAALAQGMLQVMRARQSYREVWGHAARLRILGKFSMDRNAAEWDALYRYLLLPRR